jgi:hemerythrin-like domain-containing protein
MFVLVIIIILVPQVALYLLAYLLAVAFLLLGAESIISGVKGKRKVRTEAAEEQTEGSEINVKTIKNVQQRSIVFRAIEESLGRLVKPVRGKATAKKNFAAPLQQRTHPFDLLIKEHKLILQEIDKIKVKIANDQTTQRFESSLIINTVDFFATYADEFHFGKEEILFKELSQKKLSEVDNKMMAELMTQHSYAKQTLTAIDNAEKSCFEGNKESSKEIFSLLGSLAELYTQHFQKEEEQFFPACMNYFLEQELKAMESSFLDFNKSFTDKKYEKIVEFS